MFAWCVSLTYTGVHGDDHISNTYYVSAPNATLAIDKALNNFYSEFGLNFEDDIEYIEWSYCKLW